MDTFAEVARLTQKLGDAVNEALDAGRRRGGPQPFYELLQAVAWLREIYDNVALGQNGRHRTNVWDYVSQNTPNGTTRSKLALHPTVKPVALVADAMRERRHLVKLRLRKLGPPRRVGHEHAPLGIAQAIVVGRPADQHAGGGLALARRRS